jgi:hypothetical protein
VLTSITVRNFKSFGEEQTIPLQPITVLVGPNNSGKSNLVSLAGFIRNAAMGGQAAAFDGEGGEGFVFHRPAHADAAMRIEWVVEAIGSYKTELVRSGFPPYAHSSYERIEELSRGEGQAGTGHSEPFHDLWTIFNSPFSADDLPHPVCSPVVDSREIKLSTSALRQDARVVPAPRLGADGSGLAAVLGLWRGARLALPSHARLPKRRVCLTPRP